MSPLIQEYRVKDSRWKTQMNETPNGMVRTQETEAFLMEVHSLSPFLTTENFETIKFKTQSLER